MCRGCYIYLFYNIGFKSKNCVCVIDAGSLEADEMGAIDATPHVFQIDFEVPNKAIPHGLILDYSLHPVDLHNKIILFGGLNEELKPLSSLACFDTSL